MVVANTSDQHSRALLSFHLYGAVMECACYNNYNIDPVE